MTRKEAASKIEYIIDNGQDYGYWTDAQKKALYMAIEAMEQETVSRETYEYEFNLRKMFEMKVFELENKMAEPSEDCISRQMAIDVLETVGYDFSDSELSEIELEEVCEVVGDVKQDMINRIKRMTSAQPEQRWIPFTTRPLTEEEKEMYSEWDSILDGKLPDDGQRILVSVSVHGHEHVQYDEFYTDDWCYLDSGYEIGTEAVAWMPLPEPYKESDTNVDNGKRC